MFIDNSDKRSFDYSKVVYLYTTAEVKQHINDSISNFYNADEQSLEIVEYMDKEVFSIMEFNYIDDKLIENNNHNNTYKNYNFLNFRNNKEIQKSFTYRIDQNSLGPFDYPDNLVKIFLNEVVSFQLNYTLKTYVPFYYNNNYDCSLWAITQKYDFSSRAHFIVNLNIIRYSCEDIIIGHSYFDIFINKLLWIHVLVFVLALISLAKSWLIIERLSVMYMKVVARTKKKDVNKLILFNNLYKLFIDKKRCNKDRQLKFKI